MEIPIGDDFDAAKAALSRFAHYDHGETHLQNQPDCEEDELVVLLSKNLGLYTLVACRIVYTFETEDRFGFGYGTVDHVVSGEERFEVARRKSDEGDEVVLRLVAFSRPTHWMMRLGKPVTALVQKQVGRGYAASLRRALTSSSSTASSST